MTRFVVEHYDNLIRNYRCAACWDQLLADFADDHGANNHKYLITCVNCGEDIPGFVSLHFVERMESESHSQYVMARAALKIAWPFLFPQQRKSVKKNMEQLGF